MIKKNITKIIMNTEKKKAWKRKIELK